ncbi:MAG TPA: GDSL-type esterase/lipase family protein [Anaerolineales bacterium]|nr:GDSL-type esterase/lipase family protein [Anaerolineales bacterium]
MKNLREKFIDNFNMASGMLRSMRGDPQAWEASIRRFEARERLQPTPPEAILFTGSSSITLWSTLAQDMAPLHALNRGFGGSRMADVVHYSERIILPCHPRAVVLFAGTNDIADPKPATAQQVFEGYQAFVKILHAALPGLPIFYISITPTPLRWKYWPIVQDANFLIRAHTETSPNLHFIDITGAFLGPDGLPDRRLFRLDRLHPNAKGYEKWTALIKPVLMKDFPPS